MFIILTCRFIRGVAFIVILIDETYIYNLAEFFNLYLQLDVNNCFLNKDIILTKSYSNIYSEGSLWNCDKHWDQQIIFIKLSILAFPIRWSKAVTHSYSYSLSCMDSAMAHSAETSRCKKVKNVLKLKEIWQGILKNGTLYKKLNYPKIPLCKEILYHL